MVYITSMWSELESGVPERSALLGVIAKNGYLSYCVRFKMQLNSLVSSVSTYYKQIYKYDHAHVKVEVGVYISVYKYNILYIC